MNLGSNFNNRKLLTGQSKGTTSSINMQRFSERMGARSVDEVRMSRMKLKDQLNHNIYGANENNKKAKTNEVKNNQISKAEKQFNHIEAMRNIKRGI